jgi:MerR family transcriptional regulator/heat shock protein HspR
MAETERRNREERAVYVISVAAELAGVHPQTLRIYERKGLLQPKRTQGNSRRYSQRDIEHLQRIQDLTQAAGVNLAGVKIIMEMQSEIERLELRQAELEHEVRRHRRAARERAARREPGAAIVPIRSMLTLPWERRR